MQRPSNPPRALTRNVCCCMLAASCTLVDAAEAACNDPPEPYVDWSGCNKQGAKLAGANLRRANLEHTNLKDADLSQADMRGVYMWSTYLWGANLRGANLFEADTRGAYLKECDLSNAIWQDGHQCGPNSVDGCY